MALALREVPWFTMGVSYVRPARGGAVDPNRFDTLTVRLSLPLSRRMGLRAIVSLGSGAVLLPAEARKRKKHKRKPCPPCVTRKHGACKKPLPDGAVCETGTCQAGVCVAAVTCAAPDGVRNGSETGVDCGGPCPRCGNGQGCLGRDDCTGAFCANGLCQACSPGQCGSDQNGQCVCIVPVGGGAPICITAKGQASSTCTCPPGTRCAFYPGQNGCFKLCGAA